MNFNSGNNEKGPPGINRNQTISKLNEGFNTKFSTSIFQATSKNSSSSNSIEFSSTCSVCAEIDPKFWSVSPCGHKICWICSLRMRALYNSKACPICKTQGDCVFIYENESLIIKEFFKKHLKKTASKVQFPFNESLSIGFENENIKLTCEKLLLIQCPFNNNTNNSQKTKNFTSNSILPCTRNFKSRNELKKHIQTAHDLYLCEICFEHKKVFTVELLLFNRSSLQKHQREVNHPRCQVCNSIFYSDDELYEHCRDEHELCHICKRAGVPNRHFQNYARLEEHFQRDHFLCPEPLCRDLKFVVFESELEYKAHQAEVHLAHLKMQRSQQRQLQRLNISFDNNDRNNINNINSSNNNSNNNVNSLKLTNDQRNQISVNLVYGEVTDDLANRLQSLNLYQTRNDEFIESLRCIHHLNQNQIQSLLNSARAFQRNESSATEFLIKIETIIEDEKVTLEIVKGINELQLDEMRKQRLNVAIHEYQKKCSSFPELSSSSKRGITNAKANSIVNVKMGFSSAINRNGNDSNRILNKDMTKEKETEDPFGFARTNTKTNNNNNNNNSNNSNSNNNNNNNNNNTNRTVKVLQILKSTANSNLTKNHYNNSSSDPSQNPSILLSQLAGGPSKNYKSAKKMMMPLVSSSSSRLGSFSSVAVNSSTSSSNFPTISNKIKSKNNFNTTSSTLDNEAFPSLIKGKGNDSINDDVNLNVNVRGTSDNINNSSNNNTVNNSNAFFAPSDRDQLESFTIGDEIENDDEEVKIEINEQSAVDTLKKKKTKKVVFRYGQKWDI